MRPTAQAGMVSTEFVAATALLMLPVAVLVALLPIWSETRTRATAAADQAARAAAISAATGLDAHGAAQQAAGQALADGRTSLQDVRVRPDGAAVAVDLTVRMPALPLPWVEVGAFDWTVTRTHPVDPYRSEAGP